MQTGNNKAKFKNDPSFTAYSAMGDAHTGKGEVAQMYLDEPWKHAQRQGLLWSGFSRISMSSNSPVMWGLCIISREGKECE